MTENEREAEGERPPAPDDAERDLSDPRVPAAADEDRRRAAEEDDPPAEPPDEPPAAPPDDSVWEDGLLTEPGPGD
jgi:hypothetical protein